MVKVFTVNELAEHFNVPRSLIRGYTDSEAIRNAAGAIKVPGCQGMRFPEGSLKLFESIVHLQHANLITPKTAAHLLANPDSVSQAIGAMASLQSAAFRAKTAPIASPKRERNDSRIGARARFEIMRRDGFRCQVCGRSATSDGVKLHVDHFDALVTSGDSREENLWTLCQECNLGKGVQPIV